MKCFVGVTDNTRMAYGAGRKGRKETEFRDVVDPG
jgi:hypothetical protein